MSKFATCFADSSYGEDRARKLRQWKRSNPSGDEVDQAANQLEEKCRLHRKMCSAGMLNQLSQSDEWDAYTEDVTQGGEFSDLPSADKLDAFLRLLVVAIETTLDKADQVAMKDLVSRFEKGAYGPRTAQKGTASICCLIDINQEYLHDLHSTDLVHSNEPGKGRTVPSRPAYAAELVQGTGKCASSISMYITHHVP